jgi:hypothetical protein
MFSDNERARAYYWALDISKACPTASLKSLHSLIISCRVII